MQIHVVQENDTLDKISEMYSVPIYTLITSNEIQNPTSLVEGQTIVIPIWGSYYFVEPGDSLYSISQRFGLDVDTLAQINNLTETYTVQPGERLYIPQQNRKGIYTGGYIDPNITGERSSEVVEKDGDLLSTLQVFSYEVNSQGELEAPPLENEVINVAYDTDTAPIMVITNIEEGQFSQEAATAILNDPALQERLLDEIMAIMKEKGYQGLDIDFEYLGAENKDKYNEFLKKARTKTAEFGYDLSTALAPKIEELQQGILYEGHDYAFHGKVADYIFLMTYEWGWTGGPPRAVAPIDEVEKVMEYAITKIPKDKIMMGIPLYGYDWTLPYVPGQSRARAISPQQAIALADQYDVPIEFDEESMSPYFNYVDEEGREHEVWFEDARSIQAKFDLVKRLGIRGFFYWVLGRDFPQNWLLIEDNFVVKEKV